MLEWNSLGAVIVPVDLDEPNSAALEVAKAAGPRVLHVVYVLPELEPSLMTQIDPVRRQESALKVLHEWIAENQAPEGTRAHVRIGAPSDVVPDIAGEVGAELVIMSSHGRTGFSRALMGSVAERMVRFSPCPVLVLKSGVN